MSTIEPPALKPTIGWREWLCLPDFEVEAVKAKIDTGARSSSLHAYDIKTIERDGSTWVRFSVHPFQRDSRTSISAEAKLLEYRRVRSSTGHQSQRPVITTNLELLGHRWQIELTLANRDEMGFRMLLGRQAIRGRFLIDPGKSYINGNLKKKLLKKNKRLKKRRSE